METQDNYFQGTLQLREPTEDIKIFIDSYCDKNNLTSKILKVKNGFDYYFLSQKRLISFGNLLKRKFSGYLKITRHIHTRDKQRSKNVYRVTVLFKCFKIKINQKILYKGDYVVVTDIGKKVNLKRLSDGKKFWVRMNELF